MTKALTKNENVVISYMDTRVVFYWIQFRLASLGERGQEDDW